MFTELSLGYWSQGMEIYPCITFYMHIHAPFIMHCLRLFVVVFQEINCLHTFKHAYVRRVTEFHLSTKFHACQSRLRLVRYASTRQEGEGEGEEF